MKVEQILQKAKSLLIKTGWCKFAMARDRKGNPVPYRSHEASCYCVLGALCACTIKTDAFAVVAAQEALVRVIPKSFGSLNSRNLLAYNDHCKSKAEVIAWFDLAMKKLPARERIRAVNNQSK